ncbi:winged helix-turn-helix domain-containing protein [uncultured Aurantimicrobium sp.]|uniref:winged helix-turn-helix domain-containing protein n=1 Tax=uncultured Aurantimicrobium sp. TaxID=1705357 RepID=UPI00260FCA23|nr:winged helix-turn-helix domain-containing protein [uncultured Aurantimicrobium sp.]
MGIYNLDKIKIYLVFMKAKVPALSPLFRSDSQAEILALILLHPDTEYSLTDISNLTGVNLATVHKEIERLGHFGIITERRVGKSRLVHATVAHSLYLPLLALVEHSYGPLITLTELVREMPGVESAYIFGSWAARRSGIPGALPQDIDVILIGSLDFETADSLAEQASAELHMDVNVQRCTSEMWKTSQDPFINTVKSQPLVEIPLV